MYLYSHLTKENLSSMAISDRLISKEQTHSEHFILK